jgi:2-polyprenyl-3-methyl-5-hydroxy-6-metoxy-1,4-benzoquinol methylase
MQGDNKRTKAAVDEDAHYFHTYDRIHIHEDMLKDAARTTCYRDALLKNRHLVEGKVVVDVGCGTGILSMFAVLAGARHVYALEMSEIADVAVKVCWWCCACCVSILTLSPERSSPRTV